MNTLKNYYFVAFNTIFLYYLVHGTQNNADQNVVFNINKENNYYPSLSKNYFF